MEEGLLTALLQPTNLGSSNLKVENCGQSNLASVLFMATVAVTVSIAESIRRLIDRQRPISALEISRLAMEHLEMSGIKQLGLVFKSSGLRGAEDD